MLYSEEPSLPKISTHGRYARATGDRSRETDTGSNPESCPTRPRPDSPPALSRSRRSDTRSAALPKHSPIIFNAFAAYARRYIGRHFHAMRLSGNPPDVPADRPLLVYLNHPSWWDPITCIVLARTLFPARRHFGPIDARGLAKYRILERLGLFPLELDTHRGSTEFLRKSRLILSNGGNALWVTAEGEFRDPRRRPVRLRPGVAHLARRLAGGSILPLAIEYPFWQERTPEALVRFGPPIGPSELRELTAAECNRRLEATLTETQDALADDAASRDTARFRTIVAGRAGVGGIYDLWRRARAVLTGKKFVEEHAG